MRGVYPGKNPQFSHPNWRISKQNDIMGAFLEGKIRQNPII